MPRSALLVGALLLISVTACSDDDDPVAASPSSTATATRSPSPSASASASPTTSRSKSGPWVTEVNRLCGELIDKVIAVRGGDATLPTRESYLEQRPAIEELNDDFDAEVDAITVPEDEQDAADAFTAYREFVDADDSNLKQAADSGDEAEFQKQFAAGEEPYRIQRAKLEAAGIDCPAR